MSSEPATRARDTAPGPQHEEGAQESRHGPVAQLLIAWSPLSVILAAYGLAQWITAPLGTGDGEDTNRLGFPLHVLGPARADEAVFGVVPTVWLQERLHDGTAQWYDAVAALVYLTHFVTIPLVTAIVWFWIRDRFTEWLVAVLTLSLVGVAGYVVYPAAPPWLAAQQGEIGEVERISSIGWTWLHLDVVADLTDLGQSGSNPVAAMPSLHAGAALLVACFVGLSVRGVWKVALAAYAVAMAVTLVHTGEHYVADVAAGWLVAALALVVAAVWRRRGSTRRTQEPGGRPEK